jgi:hypothetical protein
MTVDVAIAYIVIIVFVSSALVVIAVGLLLEAQSSHELGPADVGQAVG